MSTSLIFFDDPRTVAFQIEHGLQCGQQFSVIRKRVFENYRFSASYRNEGADQLSVIRSLKEGFKLGYLDQIHGTYAIHGNNASAGAKGASQEKYLRLRRALIRGFEEIREQHNFTPLELAAFRRRIANEHFWNIGYNLYQKQGELKEAQDSYLAGLRRWPTNIQMWKTFLSSKLRTIGA